MATGNYGESILDYANKSRTAEQAAIRDSVGLLVSSRAWLPCAYYLTF